MDRYWIVKAKDAYGKWVTWAGVTAPTKAEALRKAQAGSDTPVRVTQGSAAQTRKFVRNPSTADARKVLKAGQSMLARVKRVGNKLVIQPVARAARRAVKRVRRAANPSTRYNFYVQRADGGTLHQVIYASSRANADAKVKRLWEAKGATVKLVSAGYKPDRRKK